MAFITNINIQNTRHDCMKFTGRWKDSFGCPSPFGVWLIYGQSGCGKTSFSLQLTKYLTQFDRVVYWTLEQGNTQSFQESWLRERMEECGSDVLIADDDESLASIQRVMGQKRGRGILIIDSLTPLRARQFNVNSYEMFRKRMKTKLLVWISHEKQGLPDTAVGDYILKLADLKIRIEGFKAAVNTRSGEALRDFVIWEKGCAEYWGSGESTQF